MKFRPVRVAIAIAVGVIIVLMLSVAWFYVSHRYRIWANDGVYCFPLNEEDGDHYLYGDDCP
ncbi:MAG: hypothetical protein AAGD09_10080 [Cyanobacteria bacterium P01_F01_bin.56]